MTAAFSLQRVKVVHEGIGILHGQITTIHDPTNTNVIVDAPHKDLRRARSAMTSLMPTTTGSAKAIGLIYPELKGKLNGHAVRAPVLNASLTDAVFEISLSRHSTTHYLPKRQIMHFLGFLVMRKGLLYRRIL